jgi:hypothetical protein
MKLKTFKDFINEDFRSTLPGKGIIITKGINDDQIELEINFYHEKLETINLKQYMATFINKNAYNFLTDSVYGKPEILRFLLFYYNNSFTIYIFNGYISHLHFVRLLDSPSNKPKWINTESFSKLYRDCFKGKAYSDPEEEKNKLEELKIIWCLPGLYKPGKIECFASNFYTYLLAQLDVHTKLGFNLTTWNSF